VQVTHYEGDIISVHRITILNSSVWKNINIKVRLCWLCMSLHWRFYPIYVEIQLHSYYTRDRHYIQATNGWFSSHRYDSGIGGMILCGGARGYWKKLVLTAETEYEKLSWTASFIALVYNPAAKLWPPRRLLMRNPWSLVADKKWLWW